MRVYFFTFSRRTPGRPLWYVWDEPDRDSIYREGILVEAGIRYADNGSRIYAAAQFGKNALRDIRAAIDDCFSRARNDSS